MAVGRAGDDDRPVDLGIGDGVAEQVVEDRLQRPRVGDGGAKLGGQFHHDEPAGRGAQRLDPIDEQP